MRFSLRFLPLSRPALFAVAAIPLLAACSASGLELFPTDHDASVCVTLDASTLPMSPADSGFADAPTGIFDANGGGDDGSEGADSAVLPSPPPPWEIDGGDDPDAGCAGETLDNGECLVTLAAAQPNPWGIAIDPTSVYFANGGTATFNETGSIAKVGRSGGSVVTLASGLYPPRDVTVDVQNVYWDGDAIMAVGIDGGTPVTIFDDYNSTTSFITRAGSSVYWAMSGGDFGVRSAPIGGSGYTKLTPYLEIAGLAPSSEGIVWSQVGDAPDGPTALMSDVFATSATTSIYGGGTGPLKSGGGVVVFLGEEGSGSMYSIPLNGGAPTFLASGLYVTDFVTDGTYVYWTDANLRAVMKLSLAAGAPVTLASFQDDSDIYGTGSLTIDSSSVYFAEPGGCSQSGDCHGKVFKLSPR